MTAEASSATATAVNSAIMAAADQILAGIKGGNMFPSDSAAAASNISQVETGLSQGRASKVKTNEPSRCSPTGVHHMQQALKAEQQEANSTYHPYVNDANCVSQSSQVTPDELNSDLSKAVSASSLTSSEHSHGEGGHVVVSGPPMQQVTFSSSTSSSGDQVDARADAGSKRGLPQDATAVEPPTNKSRVHQEEQSNTTTQAGGQERPPTAAFVQQQESQIQKQRQGDQVPGQTTFQPILPTPPSSHAGPGQCVRTHSSPVSPQVAAQEVQRERAAPSLPSAPAPQSRLPLYPTQKPPTLLLQAPALPIAPRPSQQPHGQGGPASPSHKPVAHGQAVVYSAPPSAPGLAHPHHHPQSYYVQPAVTVQGQPPYSAPGPVPIAPTPPADVKQRQHQVQGPTADSQQPQHQDAYYQPATALQGQAYVAIAPAPIRGANQKNDQGVQGQVLPAQGYSPAHDAPAPDSQGKQQYQHQQASYLQVRPSAVPFALPPPPTPHHNHQAGYSEIQPRPPPPQHAPRTDHQKILTPHQAKPCPLQHHDYQVQPAGAQQPPQQHQGPRPKNPPLAPFSCGMPQVPRTSQIETSSIQLDHMNHQQQEGSTATITQCSSAHATATLTVAPSPTLHHHTPNNTVNNHTCSTQHPSALWRPSFPAPQAAATEPTAVPAYASAPSAQTAPEVASNLRNQKMQPTDCLLFAASLLQEQAPAVPRLHPDPHVYHQVAQQQQQRVPSPLRQVGAPTTYINASQASAHSQAGAGFSSSAYSSPLPAQSQQDQPRDLDVLCGRGGLINKHIGNIIYRRVVEHNKPFYQSVQKRHRILVSQSIVHTILNRGGRFLSEDSQTITNEDGTRSSVTLWKPVATTRAIQKTSQALRERMAASSDPASKSKSAGGAIAEEGKNNKTTTTQCASSSAAV